LFLKLSFFDLGKRKVWEGKERRETQGFKLNHAGDRIRTCEGTKPQDFLQSRMVLSLAEFSEKNSPAHLTTLEPPHSF